MAGGKSFALRWFALMVLLDYFARYGIKNIPVGLFSEDYPTLKDRQVSRIKREFPEWLGEVRSTQDEGLAFFVNESYGGGRLLLRNLDDPSKYQSSEFAAIFVEEMTKNTEQTFHDLRNRLRFPGIPDVKFMGASNPGGVGHGWVRRYFVDKSTDDNEQGKFFYVHANAHDNKYISEDYIHQLESLPEQQRKAFLDGSWDVFAGQFFSEFNRNIHVSAELPHKKQYKIGSIDWGYTNPFCFLAHAIEYCKHDEEEFNRVNTYAELYNTKKTPQEVGEMIMDTVNLSEFGAIYCDPAMFSPQQDGSSPIAIQLGDAMPEYKHLLRKASNDRMAGWNIIHKWLSLAPDGKPYWKIHENCRNLIRTLPEQVHSETKLEDVDTHGEDHPADTARYGLMHTRFIGSYVGMVADRTQVVTSSGAVPAPAFNLDAFRKAKQTHSDWRR